MTQHTTQHTPGPWYVEAETTPGQFGTDWIIRNQRKHHIAKVSLSTDAPLIAAAPDLLAALELCERALEERGPEAEQYAAKTARAAIAKAKGAR